MAVLGRLLVSSAERVDLSDLISIDSYAAGDWKYFLKGLVGDSKPYILKGFDVIDPSSAVGSQSCSIRVADSVVFYPGSSAGSFFHGMPEGHAQASPLIPELRKNATNYVYLTFSTINTSEDTRAFWDPDKDGGVGGEFTQDVNTESVLKVDVNVSTGSFPANTIPIAKIVVGASTITSIEDARHMLFRLGSGGLSPDPYNKYQWQSSPSTEYKRTEPPTQIVSGGINPFQGADKNITNMKEWMDAVMSKLAELGGTNYWYEDASTYSLISNFIDSNATAFKSKGRWMHDNSDPSLLTWTEDLHIKVTADPRTYIVRSGSLYIDDEQVMCIPMIRNGQFTSTDEQVEWTSGANYINTIDGVVGLFSHLSKGDYVKKINDSNDKYLRVEEFYDSTNLGGIVVGSTTAKSVRLSSNYLGTSANEIGRYDRGVYTASDLLISNRDEATLSSLGGNFHWLAMRSDTIQNISSITNTAIAVNISNHDGMTAKVTTGTATGLADGDRVHINGTNFNGIHKIEVESPYEFYITQVGGPFADESCTASFATVETTSRSTAYGLQLESANHGFKTDDTVTISNTFAYNNSYPIYVVGPTTFRIPLTTGSGTEITGQATLARMSVRTEGSITQIVQGQTVEIGASPADNLKQYIGMNSFSETGPAYTVPTSYGTLNGMADYNSTANENLTARVAKLTSMMADKAQDKTIKIVPSGYKSVTNTTSGPYQSITFNAVVNETPRIDIILPGSDFNSGTLLLNAPISLGIGQAAYITIDRNNAFGPFTIANVAIADIHNVPIRENVFVLATRLATSEVWLWDSFYTAGNTTTLTHYQSDKIVQQIADQFKMSIHPSNPYRIKVGGADTAFINNSRLTKSVKDLMISFDGAEIDFSTGQVYKADGVTALGVNFTPASIPYNEYFWYSIGLNSSASVNTNNTIDLEFIITPALSSGATYQTAPRATYAGEIRLGQVYVHQGGSYILPIAAENLHQLTPDSNEATAGTDGVLEFTLANNQVSPASITDFAVSTVDSKIFKAEYGIARRYLGTNGTPDILSDTAYPFSGPNGSIIAIVQQTDNKLVISGSFLTYNGISSPYVARLNIDGSYDSSFVVGSGFNSSTTEIAIQTDGKILVGGYFTNYNGASCNRITRLNTDGSIDGTFIIGTGFDGNVEALAIQSDGKILVGGSFTDYNGTSCNRIVRLNTDGSIDGTFVTGTGFDSYIATIAVQSDGKILVGGYFTNYNGTSCNCIVRLDIYGSYDSSFVTGTGFNGTIMTIKIQSDGKILAGGAFSWYDGWYSPMLARLNTNGSYDSAFTSGGGLFHPYGGQVNNIVVQSDGKIVVCGFFDSYNGITRKCLVRINSDGSYDTSFPSDQGFTDRNYAPYALTIQSDGRIVVGGQAGVTYNGTMTRHLFRIYGSDASYDAGFNMGTNGDFVATIGMQLDGKIVLGGLFTTYNGTTSNYIARLNTDGSLDHAFTTGTGFNASVSALAIQSDGKIIVGGDFTSYNGTTSNYIARLNTDGSYDSSFVSGLPSGAHYPSAIALQSDGKIVIGIWFTPSYSTMHGIARLNSNGSLDTSFNSGGNGFDSGVLDVKIQSDNKIVIGGTFTAFNDKGFNHIVRINNILSSEYMTQGSFSGIYRPSLSTWTISGQTETGDISEVALSITNAGQVQYTSTNIAGTPLESKIKFKITKL